MAKTKASCCPWGFLAPLEPPSPPPSPCDSESSTTSSTILQKKTFAQALHNSCDFPFNMLPTPCLKGKQISIKISEAEWSNWYCWLQECGTWDFDAFERGFSHQSGWLASQVIKIMESYQFMVFGFSWERFIWIQLFLYRWYENPAINWIMEPYPWGVAFICLDA